MPVDGDSLVEAPSRNTLETLASLDPSTPTKRVFGGNLTNKVRLERTRVRVRVCVRVCVFD